MGENNKKTLREISVGFAVSGLLLNVLTLIAVFQLFRLMQALFDEGNSAMFRGIPLP